MKSADTKTIIYPGTHPHISLQDFERDEIKIVNNIAKQFYVTTGCKKLDIGQSHYRYFFLKFPDDMVSLFGVTNELIVLFSPFENFEPRTLDALERIQEANPGFRLDKICAFVISKDNDFIAKLDGTIKSNKESRVITPFTYSELTNNNSGDFFRSRIKKYFFERNLFDLDSPLRKDLYFFGRDTVSHTLVDKHLSGENSALFGLRRSGKTSILYSVARVLQSKGGVSVVIDCQILHMARWWAALHYVVRKLNIENHTHLVIDEAKYTEQNAAFEFESDIRRIRNKLNKKLLIVFDEVEQITFGVSFSENWKSGIDYVHFWHVLRGSFQSQDNPLTFLIAGTNPRCLETAFVMGGDNPLYGQITPTYIQGFDVDQTKQMVSTLSSYMGIKFEDDIYTYLKREFGGHPFLIRKACSYIKGKLTDYSGRIVDRLLYKPSIEEFNEGVGHGYCEMVIGVLSEYYPDEYTMLSYLARGDIKFFNELAESDSTYTKHLIGYGVLEKTPTGFDFKIDAIQKHLAKKEKYQRINLTQEEKLTEIGSRRNNVEDKLRKLVVKVLLTALGEEDAKKQVLAKHDEKNRRKYTSLPYRDLFNPSKHEIYFDDLRELMRKNWENGFRNIFSEDIEKFNSKMVILNSIGRSDAHKKNVEDHEMQSFRGAMTWLEEKVNEFLN